MQVTLTIVRYRRRYIYFALLAMALHRVPLWLNRNISFYKLMGSGKNGTFDKNPDWQQWAILTVNKETGAVNSSAEELMEVLYGSFISKWFRFFNCETCTFFLEPIEGHGKWDGREPFGELAKQTAYEGPIAILTRATIRLSQLRSFWANVGGVASQMNGAKGLLTSIGIGEMPFIKQATFSVWQSRESMKIFAYQMTAHKEVIVKTRKEQWYSEDMFVRFKPLKITGTIRGVSPLEGIL